MEICAASDGLRLRENLCAFLLILRWSNFVGLIPAEEIFQALLLVTGDIDFRTLHWLECLRGFHGFLLFLFLVRLHRGLRLSGAFRLDQIIGRGSRARGWAGVVGGGSN